MVSFMRPRGSRADVIHADGTEVFGSMANFMRIRWAFVQPIGEWALVQAVWVNDQTQQGAYHDEYHFLPTTWVLS
jgi:hypothetical protein